MRHLHFTQSLEPLHGGGLASSTVTLHRQLLDLGVHSTLCSTFGEAPQRLATHALEFHRVKPDFIYYAPELRRNVKGLVSDAEVLHGHGLYVGTNYLFGREARRQRKSLVYHVHGFFEPWILQRSRWKKLLVHWLFEDGNFRQVRLWRALTNKEAGQIRACGIRAPIVVVPNGLALEEYPERPSSQASIETPWIPNLTKRGPRLLFLGRLHEKKGLDLLLRAWASLRAECRSWELVIAGPDERGYLSRLQDLARSLGIRDQLLFTGAVTAEPKKELLRSADLFVLPSRSEGFPMSLLEAMACSVPVIATSACNFPDITSAEAGWECEATMESLRQALAIARHAGEKERLQRGNNGRQLVARRYAWPSIISTLLQACSDYC